MYAEKQQKDFFIYLILFNLCDKAPRVVVNLSILLNRKLRVTRVKQLIFNRANIAYFFLVAQDNSSATTAPESKEEALSVGWIVPGASLWGGGMWTGSWPNYRLWLDSRRRQSYSWPGRISMAKITGWESGRCIWKIVCRLFWLERRVHSYNKMAPGQRQENNEDCFCHCCDSGVSGSSVKWG